MDVGLTVRDWRSTCRIANIDVSALAGSSAADILTLMLKAYYKTHKYAKTGRTVIYCNSDLLMYFEKQLKDKDNIHFSVKDYLDEAVLHFKNIPIKESDAILNTEAQVS